MTNKIKFIIIVFSLTIIGPGALSSINLVSPFDTYAIVKKSDGNRIHISIIVPGKKTCKFSVKLNDDENISLRMDAIDIQALTEGPVTIYLEDEKSEKKR